ncbi:hypothetical protein [Bremerella sp.]|uniref:hypothetical protein n=1 Tax=Bremerella sp. TaxID=2795602 RepID=UPI003918DCD1
MIQFDAVASHYQSQIRPKAGFNAERGNPRLVGWLGNIVAPLVEKWLEDSRFRQMATFSLSRLTRPNDSQEYAAFLAVHLGIKNLTSSIQRLIELPEVQPVLLAKFGYQQWARRCFGNAPKKWITSTLNRLTSLSQLAATSLVSENDYFSPTAGLYADEQPRLQLRNLRTNSTFRLNLPGDMIFWCLQVRLEYFCDELHRLQNALKSLPSDSETSLLIQDIAARDLELRRAERAFAETVQFSDERQKCESASTLLQAYTSTRKHDMRDWLGLNSTRQHSHHSFYFEIHGEGGIAVTDHVLVALEQAQGILEIPKSREELMDEHIATHRIVMTDGGSTFYFDGELIIDHGITIETGEPIGIAQLEFFRKLIEATQTGGVVSNLDLTAFRSQRNDSKPDFTLGNATPKAIRDRRRQLKKLIPAELNDRIKPESGGYRLTLRRDQVFVSHPEDHGDS